MAETKLSAAEARKLPIRSVPDVRHLLINDQAQKQLAQVAAKHMRPERMMRVVANSLRLNPKLGKCEPLSFLGALMTCAALGLEPDPLIGHAYLIPFRNNRKDVTEVQVVIGYRGLIDLARRSGHITSISAGVHYSDDDETGGLWDYENGTEARLRHREGAQQGEKAHVYAIAKFVDGGHSFVVLPWHRVLKIRDGSQNWQNAVKYGNTKQNPWHTHEDAMAMKTAIRALAKYLPLSVEMADALRVDEAAGDFRAFAMDPASGGPVIEGAGAEEGFSGDAPEAEAEETPEAKEESGATREPEADAPKERAEPKPKRAEKAAEPKEEAKPASLRDLLTDDLFDVTVSLREDLKGCTATEHVESVIGMMEQDLATIRSMSPEAGRLLDEMIDQHRERVAK